MKGRLDGDLLKLGLEEPLFPTGDIYRLLEFRVTTRENSKF